MEYRTILNFTHKFCKPVVEMFRTCFLSTRTNSASCGLVAVRLRRRRKAV